jgi:hypothetical protein
MGLRPHEQAIHQVSHESDQREEDGQRHPNDLLIPTGWIPAGIPDDEGDGCTPQEGDQKGDPGDC